MDGACPETYRKNNQKICQEKPKRRMLLGRPKLRWQDVVWIDLRIFKAERKHGKRQNSMEEIRVNETSLVRMTS